MLETIERDIHRTFPLHAMFSEVGGPGQTVLLRVLRAYAQYDKRVRVVDVVRLPRFHVSLGLAAVGCSWLVLVCVVYACMCVLCMCACVRMCWGICCFTFSRCFVVDLGSTW